MRSMTARLASRVAVAAGTSAAKRQPGFFKSSAGGETAHSSALDVATSRLIPAVRQESLRAAAHSA